MPNSTKRSCLTIVLAAGEGKRMVSDMPKVLHPVAGLPMIAHVLATAKQSGSDLNAVVVGNHAEQVSSLIREHDPDARTCLQTERKGTAHAVLRARDLLSNDVDDVVVLYGDVPLIRSESLFEARRGLAEGADVIVLGFRTAEPAGYGRLIVENGNLVAIREQRDASQAERAINFCNSGIMAFRADRMLEVLDAIGNNNAQQEYYLTDAVEIARSMGYKVAAIEVPEADTLGVNDRLQLAAVEAVWQQRLRDELMKSGVTMSAPHTVFFHHDTMVQAGATIEENVVFAKGVRVAKGAIVRAFSHLEGVEVGPDVIVGPYARLRPGTNLKRGSKIGNFVEVKAATIGAGAKVNHLSYIGDAEIGEKANIGAGSITCNYDGFNKHKTSIGAGAFIGSNTALVAPVKVGDNANTAAGSIVNKDVPDDALAIGRAKQVNLTGKAKALRNRLLKLKAQQKR